jgi:serine/threonine protein kinase
MGVVYRAADLSLGRPVALKTLPTTSPEDSARLRREARAMAAITHPNLALIFGVETWQATPILVIEYLPGETLAERLAMGPLAWDEALEMSLVLADALDRVHSSGILHRDVKPSNIGFTEDEVPKLLDFGLVRIAQRDAVLRAREVVFEGAATESGIAGTPIYMSPEALLGERSDPSFDLWSLGVVAFEAIAGRHPFERETSDETLHAIQLGKAIDLREARPDCPEAVVKLLEKILARERSRRPSTAREFANLLRSTAEAIAA